jgi:topoisomerase-4 subunit A
VIYRDGESRRSFIKRFPVVGVLRDREYDLTQGTKDSVILYFSANPNGEAETVKIILKPTLRRKITVFEKDFSEIMIKGRNSMGNVLTKAEIHKISLKQKGSSTLGGRQIWFDEDVLRLNYDGRGKFLGEFHGDDLILVILAGGEFYTTTYDAGNHYEENILVMEKFDENKVWTAALFDADQKFPYLKRFQLEASNKHQNLLGDNASSSLYLLSDVVYPRIEVTFGGNDNFRQPLVIDAEQFVGVKSFKAKGKRITTFETGYITELEPLRFPEEMNEETVFSEITEDSEEPLSDSQLDLFTNNDNDE